MEHVVISSGSKRSCSATTDFKKCLICQSDKEDILYRLTATGMQTLKHALDERRDEVYDRLWILTHDEERFLSQSPVCHKVCKSMYTHKRPVQIKEEKRLKVDSSNQSKTENRTHAIDFHKCCFICEKDRNIKGNRTMSLVSSSERVDAIFKQANELQDQSFLSKIRNERYEKVDLIAGGFRYHRSCMTDFMNRKYKGRKDKSHSGIERAFLQLVHEISDKILQDGVVYLLTQLTGHYRQLLQELEVPNAMTYKTEHLKNRLSSYFGKQIQFLNQKGISTLLCSSNITIEHMCSEMVRLRQELDESETLPESDDSVTNEAGPSNINNYLYMSAKCLRTQIKTKAREQRESVKPSTSTDQEGKDSESSPQSIDISYQSALRIIPTDLYNHLAWMISDVELTFHDDGKLKVADSVHERILNLAQDIMTSTTHVAMPKQVGLGLHLLKETRSKSMLTILNRFGNSISYQDAERFLTTVANSVDKQIEDDGFYIPSNLTAGGFIQCALDNLNFHENTRDGSTLHATTHNIYQYSEVIEEQTSQKVSPVTVSLLKGRSVAIDNPKLFVASGSNLSINDRRNTRNLKGVQLVHKHPSTMSIYENENFVWHLLRMIPTTLLVFENDETADYVVPSWNKFFDRQFQMTDRTVIAYGPMYPEAPTNANVVETSIDYFMQVTSKLGQDKTVVTCDQAIYDIAKGLAKKHPGKYSSLILRLGGFHIAENFMGSIGFFMKESGIEDVLVESKICGRGTANKVISGKDYYQMLRCHSLVSEAMVRLKWGAFERWLMDEGLVDCLSDLAEKLDVIFSHLDDSDTATFLSDIDAIKTSLQSLRETLNDFEDSLGPTARFWSMYIEMTHILRRYIQAERSGCWQDHLTEVQNMTPYIVSSGHKNYAVCLPLYLHDMKELDVTCPNIHKEFMQGNFCVRRTPGTFNGIWSDLALEQTYNKDGKTSLLKGITQNPATREKYLKTVPFLTAVSENVKSMAHINQGQSAHHGDSDDLAIATEAQVNDIICTITENMTDPFALQQNELVNIASGEIASSTDILSAKEIGITAMQDAELSKNNKIKLPKLVTFATQKKRKQEKGKHVAKVYQDESSVTRALCFVQGARDEVRLQAFCHEWTDYPASLFEPDHRSPQGFSMRKGNKADYLSAIYNYIGNGFKNVDRLADSDLKTVYAIDAMAFIQRFQTLGAKTFRELSASYLHKLIELKPVGCDIVHFVGDRYDIPDDVSLKCDERLRRDQSKFSPEYIPFGNLDIPDWNSMLKNPVNKGNLLNYLATSWSQNTHEFPEGFNLVLGGTFKNKSRTVIVSKGQCEQLDTLSCSAHEEADTRIVAHIYFSLTAFSCERVVVQATDTDVIMLCMYHYCKIGLPEMWIEKNNCFIPIHTLTESLSERTERSALATMDTMLSCYVLSGCDTVSYPFRRGKRHAAQCALKMVGRFPNIAAFGNENHDMSITEATISEAREFFVCLYGRQEFQSLDVLRAHLWSSGKSDLRSLPPTEDAFRLHVERALYQLALYKQAQLANPLLPPTTHFGRQIMNNKLLPVMMKKAPKPDFIKTVYCKCKKSKCLKACTCFKASVPCVVGCLCTGAKGKCGRATTALDDSSSDEEL